MKCKITGITEMDGITPKMCHAFRVGRTGDLLPMSVGYPMSLIYSDGHGKLITSAIDEIGEGIEAFTLRTHNSIYTLKKI